MVNSINKGKSFEREVAKLLTESTGVEWKRVPQSGAFATVNKSEDPRFFGDVFTENERFKDIVIECKACKDFELNELFNLKSKFFDWVEQCEQESKGKEWLLFIKPNRKGIFVFGQENLMATLNITTINTPLIMIYGYRFMKLK